jgi:phage gp29-like protein
MDALANNSGSKAHLKSSNLHVNSQIGHSCTYIEHYTMNIELNSAKNSSININSNTNNSNTIIDT